MLDSDLVRSRCQEIMDSIERVRIIKMLPLEVFLKDQDQQDIGCYRLQIAIEAALSLCYHITAKELRKVPDEYAQCFVIRHTFFFSLQSVFEQFFRRIGCLTFLQTA